MSWNCPTLAVVDKGVNRSAAAAWIRCVATQVSRKAPCRLTIWSWTSSIPWNVSQKVDVPTEAAVCRISGQSLRIARSIPSSGQRLERCSGERSLEDLKHLAWLRVCHDLMKRRRIKPETIGGAKLLDLLKGPRYILKRHRFMVAAPCPAVQADTSAAGNFHREVYCPWHHFLLRFYLPVAYLVAAVVFEIKDPAIRCRLRLVLDTEGHEAHPRSSSSIQNGPNRSRCNHSS